MSKEGTITEIKSDVFFGVFDDGTTFDMPLSFLDGHGIGTVVIHNIEDDDDAAEYDASFMLIGDEYATIILTTFEEKGFGIVEAFRVYKDAFLNGEYDEPVESPTIH